MRVVSVWEVACGMEMVRVVACFVMRDKTRQVTVSSVNVELTDSLFHSSSCQYSWLSIQPLSGVSGHRFCITRVSIWPWPSIHVVGEEHGFT